MRNDFAVFILTHGRPDRVVTYQTLRKCGYTGKIYLVVDDEDTEVEAYKARYGEQVLVFSKRAALAYTDDGMNDDDLRSPLYARNACFDLAKGLGLEWFVEADDDYHYFCYRFGKGRQPLQAVVPIRRMDDVFQSLIRFYGEAKADSLAFSQGGDWIGGMNNRLVPSLRRKVMNLFLFNIASQFRFMAKLNDDVTSYVVNGYRGQLCLTLMQVQLNQAQTQTNDGGLTEIYIENGTYVKSFYSVLYAPACVKIGTLADNRSEQRNLRYHHQIDWPRTVPCILREAHKKGALP